MKEIWKTSIVPNYEVSNLGNVRNSRTKHVIKQDHEEKGYCRLTIKHKHYAIHRLVAVAFIPNPLNKPQVDHIDNDKSNNKISNLRWVTNKENAFYRWERIRSQKND